MSINPYFSFQKERSVRLNLFVYSQVKKQLRIQAGRWNEVGCLHYDSSDFNLQLQALIIFFECQQKPN